MKKYIVVCLALLFSLASCGDDDKPYVEPLNKLTKVTCTLEETGQTVFATEITYTADGRIANIRTAGGLKQQFIYVGNTITVSSDEGSETVKYNLSGNAITGKEVSKKNEYASHVEYVSDSYIYHYEGSNMDYANWTVRWPNPDGLTYQEKEYKKDEVFTWENGNVTAFTKDKKVMQYEYGTYLRPENLPFRVIDNFSPVGFDVFSPVNFLFGSLNRNMPQRAYWYPIPDSSSPQAEYTYHYNTAFDDYLMSMTIVERSHTDGGDVTRTYEYTFEYNYKQR